MDNTALQRRQRHRDGDGLSITDARRRLRVTVM
jgi:hypothetical protein